MSARRTSLPRPDMVFFGTVMVLCVFGLLMVFSASMSEYEGTTYYFVYQLRNFAIGLVLMAILANVDYHVLRRLAYPVFALVIALLIAVHFAGGTLGGSQRWLSEGSVQPSEFAKLAVVLFAAAWLPMKGDDVRSLGYGLVPFAIVIGVVVFLVRAQPDMGTALIILATAGALFIISGADLLQTFGAGGLTSAVLLATAQLYQRERIGSFWNPCSDLNPKLEQVCQGVIAMGSGGVWGLGIGASRFRWVLHAPYSDSIMAIIGEELGLVGTGFVLVAFAVLIARGCMIALRTPDSFGRLTTIGVMLWIGFQAALSIGGVVALMPFTGVPLPFISFGGSALVSLMVGCGIVLNISRQNARAPEPARSFQQRIPHAPDDHRRGNRGSRLPGAVGR